LLWLTDLTTADPYFVLPLLCSAMTLVLFEFTIKTSKLPNREQVMKIFRVFSIFSFFVAAMFPAVGVLAM
jgi:membrane protein insertase Oxa1/YidC/SpoIIIJ